MKYKCTCCGYYTLPQKAGGTYEICKVCFGEDDHTEPSEANEVFGANNVSLTQARKNFQTFGACEKDMIQYVRKLKKDELSGLE